MGLTGNVAFVDGATSGIGQATALAFARIGASVAVVDIAELGAQATARLIEEAGGRALAVRCDLTSSPLSTKSRCYSSKAAARS